MSEPPGLLECGPFAMVRLCFRSPRRVQLAELGLLLLLPYTVSSAPVEFRAVYHALGVWVCKVVVVRAFGRAEPFPDAILSQASGLPPSGGPDTACTAGDFPHPSELSSCPQRAADASGGENMASPNTREPTQWWCWSGLPPPATSRGRPEALEIEGKLLSRTGQWSVRDNNILQFQKSCGF